VLLDQCVEVDRIEISPARVREAGNVAGGDRSRHPLHELCPLVRCSDIAATLRDLPESPQRLARQWPQHRITHAKEPAPGH
jgi:hypothetical protein